MSRDARESNAATLNFVHPKPKNATPASPDKPTRTITNRPKDRPGQWMEIKAALDVPTLWELCALIPPQSPEGARRKLPNIFYATMPSFVYVWGSQSAAEAALNEPETWEMLCTLMCKFQRKYRPHDEPFNEQCLKGTSPLTAQNYYDADRTWLRSYLDRLPEFHTRYALLQANELGYLNPDGPGSINDLRRERMLYGDGKVTSLPASIYRPLTEGEIAAQPGRTEMSHVVDRRTGKIIPSDKMDGLVRIYKDGAGRVVVGFKTVSIAVRDNEHSNSTITLAVDVDTTGSEAAVAIKLIDELLPHVPGALGVIYDTALRGTHIGHLARAGLTTVCPVAANSNPGRGKNSKKRVEKFGPLPPAIHTLPDGTECRHQLRYYGGQVEEVIPDAAGNAHYESLGTPRREKRRAKDHYRLYAAFTGTCSRHVATGGGTHTFYARWDLGKEAQAGQTNIAENVRAVPPRTDEYAHVYGWRQTIENDNNQADAHKFLRRGRSYSIRRHHILYAAGAIVSNGVAVQLHRRRRAADDVTAAPPGIPQAA